MIDGGSSGFELLLSTRRFSMVVTTSMPFVTRPNTVCLLSSQGVATVVMKNWMPVRKRTSLGNLEFTCDPFVFGPAFAIDKIPGRSCLRERWNSSWNGSIKNNETGNVKTNFEFVAPNRFAAGSVARWVPSLNHKPELLSDSKKERAVVYTLW